MTNEWKANLADFTGRMAFVLTLSKRQVEAMEWLRDGNPLLGIHFNHFIRIEDGLIRRGLIEQLFDPDPCDRFPDRKTRRIELTPAGKIVCDLCVMAGIMKKPRIKVAKEAA